MQAMTLAEANTVSAGNLEGALNAGLAGVGGTGAIAMMAGVGTAGVGAAAVVVGGFIGGVALYYLTD